jgi:16S rRNA (uracil1498-N3)-methyltransferase
MCYGCGLHYKISKLIIFASLILVINMELFYSRDIEGGICRLDHDESGHCIKVLRHRCGDEIAVIDGCGTLHKCRITSDSHKGVEAAVMESISDWGSHPYFLHLAVCPTKNNDRYEWFAEKACEIGFDRLSPIIGDHSERRVLKTARVEKILVSAAKQSLKASVPGVDDPASVKEFIKSQADSNALKLIAYCFEDERIPRRSIKDVLQSHDGHEIVVMIGPEGDFSHEEAELALAAGFIPVHLGASRLRTETAALAAAAAAYFQFMQ